MLATATTQQLAREVELSCEAILFDLDGVLVDSRHDVENRWRNWAERNHLKFAAFRPVIHGRRSIDTVRLVAPWLDADAEARRMNADQAADAKGTHPMPGARELLRRLPLQSWGVVTSGSLALAEARLKAARLPAPHVLVTGDDVAVGKPDPSGFLKGAQQLSVAPRNCVAVEDAPAGIAAAAGVGMQVVATTTTHLPEQLTIAPYLICDLSDVRVVEVEPSLRLRVMRLPLSPSA
jgi:mannitol-1-/sugar-/sorbitol-6-phosphatase